MAQSADPDKFVRVVEQAERPLTSGEVADRAGCSPQTVRNYRDRLESHPRVQTVKIGQNTTYTYTEPEPSILENRRLWVSINTGFIAGVLLIVALFQGLLVAGAMTATALFTLFVVYFLLAPVITERLLSGESPRGEQTARARRRGDDR